MVEMAAYSIIAPLDADQLSRRSTPHLPASTLSPSPNGDMSGDLLGKSQNPDSSRDIDHSSVEDGSSSKRSRALLRVPSRSSFQKNQPSPTASGLSGVTASESRDSIGGRSKGSKASIMGRTRNGSASSNRSAGGANQAAAAAAPSAPAQKKKKGGLFSLLCCGVPDDANAVDNEPSDGPGHKVEKLPPRPTTASRRPTPSETNNTSKATSALQEKDAPSGTTTDPAKAKHASGITTQEQSTSADDTKPSTVLGGPVVTVDPPLQENTTPGPSGRSAPKDEDGDTTMPDALAEATEPVVQPADVGDMSNLPPAPPLPAAPSPPQETQTPDQPQQQWLLPPIQPQFKGRKCLVLDLDETLVHSSFKVHFTRT